MAALTADKNMKFEQPSRLVSLKMNASTTIFKGSLVSVDVDGFAVPSADTASHKFMGVAEEKKTSGAVDGDTEILVRYDCVIHPVAASGAQSDVGKTVLVVDSATVGVAATTNNIAVGKVVGFVSATELAVKI